MSIFPVIPSDLMAKLNQGLHDLSDLVSLLREVAQLQCRQVDLLEQLVDPKAHVDNTMRNFGGKVVRVFPDDPFTKSGFPPNE